MVFNNTVTITNAGPHKNIPEYTNPLLELGWAIFTVFFIKRLVNPSYGRAMMGIRDNEVAAEAMGVNLFSHKIMAFLVGFLAGIGGGLLANLITTIDPKTFYAGLNLSDSHDYRCWRPGLNFSPSLRPAFLRQ